MSKKPCHCQTCLDERRSRSSFKVMNDDDDGDNGSRQIVVIGGPSRGKERHKDDRDVFLMASDSGRSTRAETGTGTGAGTGTGTSGTGNGNATTGMLAAPPTLVGAGTLRATQLTTGTPIKALNFHLPLVPPQWNEATAVFEEGGVGLFLTPSATIGTISAAPSFLGEVKGQKYQQVFKGLRMRSKPRSQSGGLVQVAATINVGFSCTTSPRTGTSSSSSSTDAERVETKQDAGVLKAQLVFVPSSQLGASVTSDRISTQTGARVVTGLQAMNEARTVFAATPVMFLANEPGQFQVRFALASFETPSSMDQMSSCVATLLPNSVMSVQHWA